MTLLLLLITTVADAGVSTLPITTASAEARALFLKGRMLADNVRDGEATPFFEKALAIDPQLALAHLYLALGASGPAKLEHLERARAAAAKATPAEQQFIALHAARLGGQPEAAARIARELTARVPDEWRVVFELGQLAYDRRDFEAAIAAYRRSMAMSAQLRESCVGYNNLGYAQAMTGQFELATLAIKRCIELTPEEPNSHDSLGEILLAWGKLDDAARAFERALALRPESSDAVRGLAVIALARGKREAGLLAYGKARAMAASLDERISVDHALAWAHFTYGDEAAAMKQLDLAERELKSAKADTVHLAVDLALTRSAIALEAGRAADALQLAGAALTRIEKELPAESATTTLRRRALARKGLAEARLGSTSTAAAIETLRQLEADLKGTPPNIEAQGALARLAAAVKHAQRDPGAALVALSACKVMGLSEYLLDDSIRPEHPMCVLERATLQLKGKEKPAGQTTLASLQRGLSRDPVDLYVRERARALAAP